MVSDLVKYIPVQRDAISKASSVFHSDSPILNLWNEFRNHLWGKGEDAFQKIELVKRDESGLLDDVELPDTHLVATPCGLSGVWDLHTPQILVRSEYTEAEQAAVSMCGEFDCDVNLITGRPGIGKSTFLLWLLMHRLSLQLPTALQICASYAILFHKDGVSEFTDLEDELFYRHLFFPEHPSCRIWALVDSNPNLLEPAGIFKDGGPFFVVNAVSPHSRHLEWLKKIGYEKFHMKSWSCSEALQVYFDFASGIHQTHIFCSRSFFGNDLTERQVWYLYNEFGASPRMLAQHSRDPALYEHLVLSEITRLSPACMTSAFRNPGFYKLFDYIMTIEPSPVGRYTCVKDIASRRVFEILWRKYIRPWVTNEESLRSLFSSSSGLVFEHRMHQLLTRQQTIKLFPMYGYVEPDFIDEDYVRSDSINLWLPESTEHKLVEGARLEDNVYYRPNSENFPSVHSLLLTYPPGETSPILIIFHFAWNGNDQDANMTILHKINALKTPPNTHKCYVVVIPKCVPYQDQQRRVSPDNDFSFFQYFVDTGDLLKD